MPIDIETSDVIAGITLASLQLLSSLCDEIYWP